MKLKKKQHFRDLPRESQKNLTSFATRELTEFVLDKMGTELDIALLYVLADRFGFGKHRLRRVFDGVFEAKKELKDRWQGNDKEVIEDMERELKSIGVDVRLWEEQKRNWLDGGYKDDECWNSYGHKGVKR